MGKKNELQELKERQAELERADQDKATLAARIAALEQAEVQRAKAEADAVEVARVQTARAVLADAEALAVQALQVLQDRLDAVQHSAAAVGPWSGMLPDQLFAITRNTLQWLKENWPEVLGLAPLPTKAEKKLARLRSQVVWLTEKAGATAPRDRGHDPFGYKQALRDAKAQLAILEGRSEPEPELNYMDKAYLQQVTTFDLKRGKTTQTAPVKE